MIENLKHKAQIAVPVFFPIYLATVLITDLSFTGYWTDIIFSILLSIFGVLFAFKNKTGKPWLTLTLRITNIIAILIVSSLLGLNLINPFAWDTLYLRSFYFQPVEGRLFNAYFRPVGAYSGGEGGFWITETPKYFPILEWRVYWDSSVDHDFRSDTLGGQPVDNYAVVRSYIKNKVIDQREK